MLLDIPSSFKRPRVDDNAEQHEIACDWIEASILFSGSSVTFSEMQDALEESQIFPTDDEAETFAQDAWNMLQDRHRETGSGVPFKFGYQRLSPTVATYEQAPAYSFCVLLSYAGHHRAWARTITWDVNEQGAAFEALTLASVSALLPAWTVHGTGWSRNTPTKLPQVVKDVATRLCGDPRNVSRWTTKNAKEAGLDVLAYREFPDQRGNFPAFFVQCASGLHLEGKLKHPDMQLWTEKLVELVPSSLPRRAVATPFALPRTQFERHALRSEGLLLDRQRLLSAGDLKPDWVNPVLGKRLVKWIKKPAKKLKWLP